MKLLLFFLPWFICLPLAGQTPTFEELVFEADSTVSPYRPSGKNYVFIRSKRGTGGVTKSSRADSITSFEITDIVLVFSEINPNSINNREAHNRERWENLLTSYPGYFQYNTNLKDLCQCNAQGDTSKFRPVQGFYVYYAAKEEPKVETPKVVEKKVEKDVADAGKKDKKEEKSQKEETAKKEDKSHNEESARHEDKSHKEEEAVKKEEKSHKEDHRTKNNDEFPDDTGSKSGTASSASSRPKKAGTAPTGKPRRTKDPKACRLPCYESGDDDLNAFFKSSITLTKKQKRHSKDLVSILKLQLNYDGSIKKVIVTGVNEVLNAQVTGAANAMNNWNPAIKSGVTVKSEVKMTLKYDKSSKALKPFEIMITPRLGPKCPCTSDSELFSE